MTCPECGYPVVMAEITSSTIPVVALTFCGGCGVQILPDGTVGFGSQAEWAEHFDGDILRMPTISLGEEAEGAA